MTIEELCNRSYGVWYARDGIGLQSELRLIIGLDEPSINDLSKTHDFIGVFEGDDPGDIFWQLNEFPLIPRSMACGDILVTGNNRVLVCDVAGWTNL